MAFSAGLSAAPAAVCLALFTAACAPVRPVVEVPVSQWPGYEYFALAHREELDRATGIRIRPVEYPDPQDIVHAYLRGDVRIAQLTTVEVVDICARVPERCPVVVLVLDESAGGDVVLARPPIGSVADLRGRRVAVAFSTLGPYVLARALERSAVALNAVTLQGMPLEAMGRALARGEVDAAVFFPPFSARVEREQLSLAEFRATLAGLRFYTLQQQVPLLAVGGPIARNLAAVQRVQRQLGVLPAGGGLPVVTDGPVREALER